MSVEEVAIYKPHPSVYNLAVTALQLDPEAICSVSANAWDAHGAAAFGMQVVWCNRYGQPAERLPGMPAAVVASLAGIPPLVL